MPVPGPIPTHSREAGMSAAACRGHCDSGDTGGRHSRRLARVARALQPQAGARGPTRESPSRTIKSG
eukprot:SAG22_NODE_14364_length_376_cov_1.108303_1_plen_66_part_01